MSWALDISMPCASKLLTSYREMTSIGGSLGRSWTHLRLPMLRLQVASNWMHPRTDLARGVALSPLRQRRALVTITRLIPTAWRRPAYQVRLPLMGRMTRGQRWVQAPASTMTGRDHDPALQEHPKCAFASVAALCRRCCDIMLARGARCRVAPAGTPRCAFAGSRLQYTQGFMNPVLYYRYSS